VTLFEAQRRLGGQALLAQLLPGRAEFGGLVTNLLRELENAGVSMRTGTRVDRALIDRRGAGCVIAATGARPYWPAICARRRSASRRRMAGAAAAAARSAIRWSSSTGAPIGSASASPNAARAERSIGAPRGQRHRRRRDSAALRARRFRGTLHRLGVKVLPYMRLYGSDSNSVYLQHIASGEAVVIDEVDTLVLCTGHEPVDPSSRMTLEDLGRGCASSAMRPRRARPKRPFSKDSRPAWKFELTRTIRRGGIIAGLSAAARDYQPPSSAAGVHFFTANTPSPRGCGKTGVS
jgi:hypothetical protein